MEQDLGIFAATDEELLLDEAELEGELDVQTPSPAVAENINEA
ncbi:hypothetical protein [Paractinoplanes lichenicola]|nr:hypothetical protein [Actinoplanes lichenicola]